MRLRWVRLVLAQWLVEPEYLVVSTSTVEAVEEAQAIALAYAEALMAEAQQQVPALCRPSRKETRH